MVLLAMLEKDKNAADEKLVWPIVPTVNFRLPVP